LPVIVCHPYGQARVRIQIAENLLVTLQGARTQLLSAAYQLA